MAPRRARLSASALAALTMFLAGCFTVEGTLDANGSGSLELTYYLWPRRHVTVRGETERFSSEHVTVESLSSIEMTQVVARVRFDDVTRISTAEAFRGVAVSRTRKGGRERLHILIRYPLAPEAKETLDRWGPRTRGPRVALTLAGRVIDASPSAQVQGHRVVWQIPLEQYTRTEEITLTVRYTVPPEGTATPPAGHTSALTASLAWL